MKSNTNDMNNNPSDAAPVPSGPAKQSEPKPVQPQMGRMQRFGRSLLIWLIVIVIAFLAGVLTFNFTLYQPLAGTLKQTQGDLTKANQNLSQVTADVTAVNDQLTGIKADNQAMQSKLEAATDHLALQQVLVEITNARLALANNDVQSAKTALQQTEQQLGDLTPRIAAVDAKLAESMPQRLALVLSELDSSVDTAKVDLELLAENLTSVEGLLFKK